MSKTQLKKELQNLNKEQLVQLVLDAYGAKREIKEYFDFFLNPDVDKLFDRVLTACVKEIVRIKYGRMRMRVSVLKGALKDFAAYEPEVEWELKLMYELWWRVLGMAYHYTHVESVDKYLRDQLTQLIIKSDRALLLDQYLPKILKSLQQLNERSYLRRELQEITDNASELIIQTSKK